MSTTKLLERIRAEDQKALAERHNQRPEDKKRRSGWVIDTLRNALPPHHVALANRLLDMAATAAGLATVGEEVIDGGNGREGSLQRRMDAQRALEGFAQAVTVRLGANGQRCFRAIVSGATWIETTRACGFSDHSGHSMRRLVQLTMINAEEYDEECRADARAHREACALLQITP